MEASTATARRTAHEHRQTSESDIEIDIEIDGSGQSTIGTGLPFFDHMLSQLAKHSGMDVVVRAVGDLEVDAHHTVEDTALLLGKALSEALGDKAGVRRFASVSIPLDEALVDVALDLSGRPYLRYDVALAADATPLGSPGFDPQLAEEFFRALATSAGLTLHVSLRYGKNTHHIVEASFKALARALKDAVRVEGASIPSTKGVLTGP